MSRVVPEVSLRTLFLVLHPRRYIAAQPLESGIVGRLNRGKRLAYLSAFFAFNAAVLVAPIFTTNAAGELIATFVATAGLTFWVFYACVLVAGDSADVISTFRSVVYCTGVYLSALFSVLLLFASPIGVDRLDFLGAIFQHARRQTERFLAAGDASYVGYFVGILPVVFVLLALAYYLYSLYLAARIRHGVDIVPAMYVAAVTLVLPVALGSFGVKLFSGTGTPTVLAPVVLPIERAIGYSDGGFLVLGGVIVVLGAIFINNAVIKSHQ